MSIPFLSVGPLVFRSLVGTELAPAGGQSRGPGAYERSTRSPSRPLEILELSLSLMAVPQGAPPGGSVDP